MGHKQQLSKGHRRGRSERRKGSQRNQTPDSQKGAACFSTFKQVFRFIFHWRRIYFVFLFVFFGSGGVRGLSAFGSLAFRPGFGFLFSLASWFFGFWASWPLNFL